MQYSGQKMGCIPLQPEVATKYLFNKHVFLFFPSATRRCTFVSSITNNDGATKQTQRLIPDLKLFMRLYTGNRRGANEHRAFFLPKTKALYSRSRRALFASKRGKFKIPAAG